MYHEDWLIRQIRFFFEAIARVLFNKEKVSYVIENPEDMNQSDALHARLLELIGEGRLNEAENLLFEGISSHIPDGLLLAADFYQRLNGMSDEALESCGFSRQEIQDGMKDALRVYGVSELFE